MSSRGSPARRRYLQRFFPAITLYGLLLAGSLWWLVADPPEGALRYAVAVAPALPIVWIVWIVAQYLMEEEDEFRRALFTQSVLWGTAFVLAASTVWGFLEESAGAPHIPLFWVFPAHCFAMAIAQGVLARKYA